jgi:hypothetical protein
MRYKELIYMRDDTNTISSFITKFIFRSDWSMLTSVVTTISSETSLPNTLITLVFHSQLMQKCKIFYQTFHIFIFKRSMSETYDDYPRDQFYLELKLS